MDTPMATQDEIARFQAMDAANRPPGPPPGPAAAAVARCPLQSWVAVELRRVDGEPAAGAAYVLTLPDGSRRTGRLDSQGYALERDVGDSGRCVATFPAVSGVLPA